MEAYTSSSQNQSFGCFKFHSTFSLKRTALKHLYRNILFRWEKSCYHNQYIKIEKEPVHFHKFSKKHVLSELFHISTFKNWVNLNTKFNLTLHRGTGGSPTTRQIEKLACPPTALPQKCWFCISHAVFGHVDLIRETL